MKKNLTYFCFLFFIIFYTTNSSANSSDVKNWLKYEIDQIINLYKNDEISAEVKLNAIKETINKSFAGKSIAKFVVGNKWDEASEEVRENFVELFKEHLSLTVGSLMQSYSNQKYELIDATEVKKGLFKIDMELTFNEQKTLVTWGVKEHKNKFYVMDLIIADISLMRAKRSEFSSVLKKKNLKELNIILKDQNLESYNNLIN
ncbi:MAG: hypothetical protein CFH22_00107 [Alphaproteobacteria bacterium MarineAlpha5_Bin12]|nr:hypothetical protein [Pelagibacteraceae bacterium]PPR42039.1 MAG: hypothetical protein CFH22_00107 [Alphaproteobacteria bacterium MarineAlpha5_Bin12]|tara:strand:+ start:13728 stop:14336 length:609 start_codon:yes stop_codon:yes gene_type:complete